MHALVKSSLIMHVKGVALKVPWPSKCIGMIGPWDSTLGHGTLFEEHGLCIAIVWRFAPQVAFFLRYTYSRSQTTLKRGLGTRLRDTSICSYCIYLVNHTLWVP